MTKFISMLATLAAGFLILIQSDSYEGLLMDGYLGLKIAFGLVMGVCFLNLIASFEEVK